VPDVDPEEGNDTDGSDEGTLSGSEPTAVTLPVDRQLYAGLSVGYCDAEKHHRYDGKGTSHSAFQH